MSSRSWCCRHWFDESGGGGEGSAAKGQRFGDDSASSEGKLRGHLTEDLSDSTKKSGGRMV